LGVKDITVNAIASWNLALDMGILSRKLGVTARDGLAPQL
jgi:hypothetical protein